MRIVNGPLPRERQWTQSRLLRAVNAYVRDGFLPPTVLDRAGRRETDDRLYAAYQGAIEGRFELALNARRKERFYALDLQPAAEFARRNEVHADRYWTLSLNWTAALILALAGGLFAAGTWLGVGNGVIGAFVLVLMFLRMPLNDLIGSLPTLVAGNVSLAKIQTLAFADYRNEFSSFSGEADINQPLLELQGLGYDYPHQADDYGFRLGPVNLSVARGEILFIVGGNGSGKSTLAKLLTGLYEPSAGTLKLQGVTITPELRDWYRAHFSTVFSTFYLFERLVGPRGDFDPLLAQAWLERLRMQRKVSIDAQGGLSTTRLSQGQRKRLALLRHKTLAMLSAACRDLITQRSPTVPRSPRWLMSSGSDLANVTCKGVCTCEVCNTVWSTLTTSCHPQLQSLLADVPHVQSRKRASCKVSPRCNARTRAVCKSFISWSRAASTRLRSCKRCQLGI